MFWKLTQHHQYNQVILAFWLVLAYDLLEDRYTIDVIGTKFLLLHFKMAESFGKQDSILREWLKIKYKIKPSCQGIEQIQEAGKSKKKACFSFREWLRKNSRAVSVRSWARLNQTQNWSCSVCLEFNKFNTQSVCYINIFKKKFNFSQS